MQDLEPQSFGISEASPSSYALGMDHETFARQFEDCFRETYLRAVRRVSNKRDWLTPETRVLLNHLLFSGPLTPGEMARHLRRAPSSISEMLEHLCEDGLLERDRDPKDGRRSLIWLSDAGRQALEESRQVLDLAILGQAALSLHPAERKSFLTTFEHLLTRMKESHHEHEV